MMRSLVTIVSIVSLLAVSLGSLSCARQTESITIGTLNGIKDTLIFVAADEGYFNQNGLNVRLETYSNGVAAVGGMLNGEVEIAYASEFVSVQQAFKRTDFSIFVVEGQSTGTFVVGRKDRGIQNASDLKDKRIGVPKGAIPEFYLGRFLSLNGISLSEVAVVYAQPANLTSSLAAGTVDAVVAAPRWFKDIKGQQDDKVVYWPAESDQPSFDTLVATNAWLKAHPDTVIRFLKSLDMAQDYVLHNPTSAQEIANKRLNWDSSFMAEQWRQIYFSLSLNLSLIAAMKNEGQWMIANGLTTEDETPDFYNYIYVDGLKALRPEAVNIVR